MSCMYLGRLEATSHANKTGRTQTTRHEDPRGGPSLQFTQREMRRELSVLERRNPKIKMSGLRHQLRIQGGRVNNHLTLPSPPAPSTRASPVMPPECMFAVQLISTVPIQKQVGLIEPMWKHMTGVKDISVTSPSH